RCLTRSRLTSSTDLWATGAGPIGTCESPSSFGWSTAFTSTESAPCPLRPTPGSCAGDERPHLESCCSGGRPSVEKLHVFKVGLSLPRGRFWGYPRFYDCPRERPPDRGVRGRERESSHV